MNRSDKKERVMNLTQNHLKLLITVSLGLVPMANAFAHQVILKSIHKHITLSSTVPGNGDQNPYAIIVAPVTSGNINKGDVLVDNFNDKSNLQGTGTTIIDYRPSTKKTTLFASLPKNMDQCPGGIGLSTAMTMLKSGWVIVGSTPSTDGTTTTKGDGCLIVLDNTGHMVTAWSGSTINDPWGNMAVIDNGSTATIFVSMAPIIHKATVVRMEILVPEGKPPVLFNQTVIGSGFSQRADKDSFLFGPTGLALGSKGTLYVTDVLDNAITAIPDAVTRSDSAGTGSEITRDGQLAGPLAMVMTTGGHLLVSNGNNGKVVEVDPISGKQIDAQWVDQNPAQTPPGSGDLFGIAMTPNGKGFYYVQDDTNTLMEAI
jgi:hypothetical protein